MRLFITISLILVGVGMGFIFRTNLTLDVRCTYSVNLHVGSAAGPTTPITIDSIAYFPNYELSEIHLQTGTYVNNKRIHIYIMDH